MLNAGLRTIIQSRAEWRDRGGLDIWTPPTCPHLLIVSLSIPVSTPGPRPHVSQYIFSKQIFVFIHNLMLRAVFNTHRFMLSPLSQHEALIDLLACVLYLFMIF